MNITPNVHKTPSFWLLSAATFVIALEALVPQFKGTMPEHWYAWLIPAALVARLIKQQLEPKPKKVPVRLEESGFTRIKLMLGLALLAVVSCTVVPVLAGCSPQGAKTAAHLASNGVAKALSWVDGRLAPQFKIASEAKIKELAAEKKPFSEWEAWEKESGWAAAIKTVALAMDAQVVLAQHIAGTDISTERERQDAFELVTKALDVGLDLLEKEHVEVPVYVRAGVQQLPALGALL